MFIIASHSIAFVEFGVAGPSHSPHSVMNTDPPVPATSARTAEKTSGAHTPSHT